MKRTLFWLLTALAFATCEKEEQGNLYLHGDIIGFVTLQNSSGNWEEEGDYGGCKVSIGIDSTITDSDGKFVLENVPRGAYNVTVTKEGYSKCVNHINHMGGAATTDNYGVFGANNKVSNSYELDIIPDVSLSSWEYEADSFYCNIMVNQKKHISGELVSYLYLSYFVSTSEDVSFDENYHIKQYKIERQTDPINSEEENIEFSFKLDTQEISRILGYPKEAYLQFVISKSDTPLVLYDEQSHSYINNGMVPLKRLKINL